MDLALNSDLCSSLLDCWEEPREEAKTSIEMLVNEQPRWGYPDMEDKDKSSSPSQAPASSVASSLVPVNTTPLSTETTHEQIIPPSADCLSYLNVGNPSAACFPLAMNALLAGLMGAQNVGSAAVPQQQPQVVKQELSASRMSTTDTISVPSQSQPTDGTAVPPFLLFDAPMELRANFIQSLKALGLPVLQDNNSYHYNMALQNSTTPSNLRLIDARQGRAYSKRQKNAKEQRRAQEVAQLIEELRVKMEKDGWNVELKSKYHTLSS
jgi:hypothetical protein